MTQLFLPSPEISRSLGSKSLYNESDELEEVDGFGLWHLAVQKDLGEFTELGIGIQNLADKQLHSVSDLMGYYERGRFAYVDMKFRF